MKGSVDLLFYDGTCGLCHRAVSFILNRWEAGQCFRFAALQGETFRERIPEERRASLPDSLLILTSEGAVLARSGAMLHILRRLGGGWRWLGWMGGLLPRFMLDGLYNLMARYRHRLFRKPADMCPSMTHEQRTRFDP